MECRALPVVASGSGDRSAPGTSALLLLIGHRLMDPVGNRLAFGVGDSRHQRHRRNCRYCDLRYPHASAHDSVLSGSTPPSMGLAARLPARTWRRSPRTPYRQIRRIPLAAYRTVFAPENFRTRPAARPMPVPGRFARPELHPSRSISSGPNQSREPRGSRSHRSLLLRHTRGPGPRPWPLEARSPCPR
jgi:hypothetical protein